MQTDVLVELFKAEMLNRFRRRLIVHEALRRAYRERTGRELTRESDYSADDKRRALRILKADNVWRTLL